MKNESLETLIKNLIPKKASQFLPLIWGTPIDPTPDFIYPDELTPLRPGKGKNGVKMNPQYVVIHDTGMTNPEDNGVGLSRYIHAQASSPTGRVASWHFSVDDHDCFQHVPTDEQAWHAGDGRQEYGATYFHEGNQVHCIGGGNKTGIGIESCINPGNDYFLTVMRLARVTAQLLNEYDLGLDRIKQHYDFSGKNCPNVIRATNGLWDSFLQATAVEYALLAVSKQTQASWKIDPQGIILPNGVVKTVLQDRMVHLELTLTIDGKSQIYQYDTLVAGLSEENRIERTRKGLLSSLPQVVTGPIMLPSFDKESQVTITWESSHQSILATDGTYHAPHTPQIITLSANLKTKSITKKILFDIEVR
ncbi:MAG: N-acetylmuramoyl-L-alanine amidase [Bacilli bacterium]